jgi:hypothetical protein
VKRVGYAWAAAVAVTLAAVAEVLARLGHASWWAPVRAPGTLLMLLLVAQLPAERPRPQERLLPRFHRSELRRHLERRTR